MIMVPLDIAIAVALFGLLCGLLCGLLAVDAISIKYRSPRRDLH
mgnify:CR=1 FL=1